MQIPSRYLWIAGLLSVTACPVHASDRCQVDAAALAKTAGSTVLVDVRSADNYARVWIPGSANLGVSMLASNLLVKSAPSVVLVGNGKDGPGLLQRCHSLHAHGMTQIRVLQGGLPAWNRAGGALAGNAATLDQPLVMNDAELHAWLSQGGDVIVLADDKASPAITATGVQVIQRGAHNTSDAALLSRIPKAEAESTSVLVFLRTNTELPKWRALTRSKGLPDPVFFVGAPSSYDHYLEQLTNIAKTASAPSGVCRPN